MCRMNEDGSISIFDKINGCGLGDAAAVEALFKAEADNEGWYIRWSCTQAILVCEFMIDKDESIHSFANRNGEDLVYITV